MAVIQPSASKRSTDALDLLTADHRTVEELFGRYEALLSGDDSPEKRHVVETITRELTVHAELEESIFYPTVRQLLAEGEELVDESLQEHGQVKGLLAELEAMEPGSAGYDARVMNLIGDVRHHVNEEEGEMFPKLRSAVGQPQLEQLGRRMREAKTERAISAPVPTSELVPSLFQPLPTPKRATRKPSTAKKPTARRPPAKKSTAKKTTAKKSTAKKTTAKKTTAKKTTAKKTTAKKTTAKKTTAKKTTARRAGAARKAGARKVYHVVANDRGGWSVQAQGATRASSSHGKKEEAVARGRQLAQRQRLAQLVVHAKSGSIQSESTYGEDPRSRRG
jgi:hemerythrin superfamily protein